MLDEVLSRVLASVEGVRCVLLAGRDGVVVAAAVAKGGPVPDAVAASFAALFGDVAAAHRSARLLPPKELMTKGPSEQTVSMEVTPQYLLIAVIDGHASLGKLRFELRKAAATFEDEFR